MSRRWIGMAVGAVAVGSALLAAAFAFRPEARSSTGVEALGLRGTAKVSRPLSATQVERLETHFLDVPAPATTGAATGPSRVPAIISQVNAINRLNERQAR